MSRAQSTQSAATIQSHSPAFDGQQFQLSQHEQQQQQFSFEDQFSMQPNQQMSQQQQTQMKRQHDEGVDDSGICMNFMDDDLNFAKFGMTGAHIGHEFNSGEINVI